MSDFEPALKKLLAHEGYYSNHPADRGGETYCGISRKHWPHWPGWPVYDADGGKPSPEKTAKLAPMAAEFYRGYFWEPLKCGLFRQYLADELLDAGVNCGPERAVKWLQETFNLLNRNSAEDIAVDGKYGHATMAAVGVALARGDDYGIYVTLKALRAGHYIDMCRRDPAQRVFYHGWIGRVFPEH